MQQAPKSPSNAPDLPPLMSNADALTKLESEIYGPIPTLSDTTILTKRVVAKNAFTSGDTVTEWAVSAGYGATKRSFNVVLITKDTQADAPFIIAQNFCPNTDVVPLSGITPPEGVHFSCSDDGMIARVFGYFFGRYITVLPYNMILDRGYNVAILFPPEFVMDSTEIAPDNIRELFGSSNDNKSGALAIWASLSNWLAGELKTNSETSHVITYGHSRYGKTALLSAATSEHVDGVIAHQSGTGGASIFRDGTGESVADIVGTYPHWFSPNFAKYANKEESLPVDAHNLLSLIAPRPVFLGNARRDVWSDPAGAYNAAKATSPAWVNSGKIGLTSERLDQFKPEDDIAFWLRPGTHGIVKEDWPAFLEFMDAHFQN